MIRAFAKKDTIAVAKLARNAFEKNDAKGYYDQTGLPVLLDYFDAEMHCEQKMYERLGAAEFFYVYEERGEVVGFIRGSFERLGTVAVEPAHQGEGIGAKLV